MRWPSLDDQVAHRLRVVASHIGICSRWPSGLSIGSSVIRCREDLVVSCRICGVGCDGGPMLCPCRCSGSIKYVHIDCLNRWRAAKLNPLNELRCEICHADFRYVHVDRDGNAKQELRRPAPGDIRMLVLKRLAVWHMLFLAAAVGIGLLSKLLAPSFGGAGSRVLGSAEAARGHGKGLVPEWLECGIFSMLGICTLLSVVHALAGTSPTQRSSSAAFLDSGLLREELQVLQLPSCLHLLLDGSECALFHGIALSLTGSTFAGMGLFLASVITILRRTEEMVKAEVVYQARFQRPRTRPEFVDAFTF
mmetsp:Transcript_111031/g.358158  ORF Transcript_111031/g.358158 Transcript_111031/m.358158 type:complete len:307 (-) Transcript_111031:283-1203(-)